SGLISEPARCGCGRSASERGEGTGSRAEGVGAPERIPASAPAPRVPGYQGASTAPTRPTHGIPTGPPVSNTTHVRGLAAATAFTSASWLSGSARLGASRPSLIGCVTKTMATSDRPARDAAALGSAPSLYSTRARGAAARIALSGDEG